MTRHYHAVALLLIALSSAACGGGDRPQTVRVSGRVTLDGGSWPQSGVLIFAPVNAEPGFPLRPGRAPFDTEGYFEAETWEAGDGLVPGKYKVAIENWSVPPSMDGPPAIGPVPDKYRTVTTSDLTVVVPSDTGPKEFTFDIPSRSNSK